MDASSLCPVISSPSSPPAGREREALVQGGLERWRTEQVGLMEGEVFNREPGPESMGGFFQNPADRVRIRTNQEEYSPWPSPQVVRVQFVGGVDGE